MTLRTLNYGNYGISLIMGNAGFCPSTVVWFVSRLLALKPWGLLGLGLGCCSVMAEVLSQVRARMGLKCNSRPDPR